MQNTQNLNSGEEDYTFLSTDKQETQQQDQQQQLQQEQQKQNQQTQQLPSNQQVSRSQSQPMSPYVKYDDSFNQSFDSPQLNKPQQQQQQLTVSMLKQSLNKSSRVPSSNNLAELEAFAQQSNGNVQSQPIPNEQAIQSKNYQRPAQPVNYQYMPLQQQYLQSQQQSINTSQKTENLQGSRQGYSGINNTNNQTQQQIQQQPATLYQQLSDCLNDLYKISPQRPQISLELDFGFQQRWVSTYLK